jgi:hypothetical protein
MYSNMLWSIYLFGDGKDADRLFFYDISGGEVLKTMEE